MPGAIEKFVIDSGGARDVLRSRGVQAELLGRARQVKAVADAELARLDAPYPGVVADATTGTGRASATVLGVPLPLERSRRILGGAIDAAAG